jgi:hypothetical protein
MAPFSLPMVKDADQYGMSYVFDDEPFKIYLHCSFFVVERWWRYPIMVAPPRGGIQKK